MKYYLKRQFSGCRFLHRFLNIDDKRSSFIKIVTVIGIISAILICLLYEDLTVAGLLTGIVIGLNL